MLRRYTPSPDYHDFTVNVRCLVAETELPVALRVTALLEAVWGVVMAADIQNDKK